MLKIPKFDVGHPYCYSCCIVVLAMSERPLRLCHVRTRMEPIRSPTSSVSVSAQSPIVLTDAVEKARGLARQITYSMVVIQSLQNTPHTVSSVVTRVINSLEEFEGAIRQCHDADADIIPQSDPPDADGDVFRDGGPTTSSYCEQCHIGPPPGLSLDPADYSATDRVRAPYRCQDDDDLGHGDLTGRRGGTYVCMYQVRHHYQQQQQHNHQHIIIHQHSHPSSSPSSYIDMEMEGLEPHSIVPPPVLDLQISIQHTRTYLSYSSFPEAHLAKRSHACGVSNSM